MLLSHLPDPFLYLRQCPQFSVTFLLGAGGRGTLGSLGESPEGWQGWSFPRLCPMPVPAGPQRDHAVVGGGSQDPVDTGTGWQGPQGLWGWGQPCLGLRPTPPHCGEHGMSRWDQGLVIQSKPVYCATNPCLYRQITTLPCDSSDVIGCIHCPHAVHLYFSVSDSCDVISHEHQTPPQDSVCLASCG